MTHMKGRILQALAESAGMWDYELFDLLKKEYGVSGAYWGGSIRLTLADLSASGIIQSMEEKLDDGKYFASGKVLGKYQLTEFGRERMKDTGLLDA